MQMQPWSLEELQGDYQTLDIAAKELILTAIPLDPSVKRKRRHKRHDRRRGCRGSDGGEDSSEEGGGGRGRAGEGGGGGERRGVGRHADVPIDYHVAHDVARLFVPRQWVLTSAGQGMMIFSGANRSQGWQLAKEFCFWHYGDPQIVVR